MKKLAITAALAAMAVAAPASAQTVSFNPGTLYTGPALTGYSTTGSLMGGMLVTWTFTDGLFGSATWGDLGDGDWGVKSGGFTMRLQSYSDTFIDPWSMFNNTGKSIASVRFNGAPGRTLFDCAWGAAQCQGPGAGPDEGTEGSARGYTLRTESLGVVASATYSNMYRLNTLGAPVGDLFEQLEISFGQNGLGTWGIYQFTADTDNSTLDAPPPTTSVPEPASLALVIPGIAAFAAIANRRRRRV